MDLREGPQACAGLRHQQRRAHAVAAHVAHDQGETVVEHGDIVEIIAGGGLGGQQRAGDVEPRQHRGLGRIQALLNFARGAKLLGRVAHHLLGPMPPAAFDGVADRADQQMIVHLALDEVVLRAGLHGLDRALFVVVAREDDDRHIAHLGVHGEESLQPPAVGQAEVEQDYVKMVFRATLDGRGE